MASHLDTPSTGFYVIVDLAIEPKKLREELAGTGIHVVIVKDADKETEYPEVRLRSASRTKLEAWLTANHYDRDAHPITFAGRRPGYVGGKGR